jgi:hypothetical protein
MGDAPGACVICRKPDDDTHRYFLGAVDGGQTTVLQACPDDLSSPRITRPKDQWSLNEAHIIGGINLMGPVRVTPQLAESIARVLSTPDPDDEDDLGYPGTTAEQVMTELGKPGDISENAGGRDVIGILACGWLRDAMNEGVVFADAEGILAAKS